MKRHLTRDTTADTYRCVSCRERFESREQAVEHLLPKGACKKS